MPVRPAILRMLTAGFVGLSSWVVGAQAADVEGLRIWSGPDTTRVVLDLSQPLDHRVFTLKNPHRVVVDLSNAKLRVPSDPEPKGFVSSVRTGPRPANGLRVVFDLKERVKPQSFVLTPNDTYGHRLVIDLKPAKGGSVVKRAPAVVQNAGRELVVAIDPGHGGEDPGATGRRGVREKDVVLAISKKLAAAIDAEPGMRAILMREGDYFVSLMGRMEKARASKADLFISIHADAFRTVAARGATVYVLSKKGASDEAARRLAERENASDLIGGVSLKDKDQMLAKVLLDLSQNAAITTGSAVGQSIIQSLSGVTRVRKRRVQQAPFLVLKSPDIPSILIETAYISNPQEEVALSTGSHQKKLAGAIKDGIRNYFYANPPPGTLVAQLAEKNASPIRHVIARGDTLSGIAERYRVPVRTIRSTNRIRGDRILIGQVLTIPRS